VPRPHHVLLVPGFFGFANLGDFAYFAHVRDYLAEICPRAGITGELRVVRTVPTASLRKRAALVAEAIDALLDFADGEVTIVGHSSGGLDARLVVTPRVSLPTPIDVERCARSVRAVVTVSTPHYGTPLAHLFNSLLGQQLLHLLSLSTIYSLRAGRLPLRVALKFAALLRGRGARPSGVIAQLVDQLLADFSLDRRQAVEEFFRNVGQDQDLVAQIAPAGMDLFNASTEDRPGVAYGCVVTRGRKPGLRSVVKAGFHGYAQATHALYVALYRLASGGAPGRGPRLDRAQAAALRRAYGRVPDTRANDGIVPSLSQVWGEVVGAVWADHHDIIGHFDRPTHVPPHFDWVASGTGFDRPQFEAVWRQVARFAARAAG